MNKVRAAYKRLDYNNGDFLAHYQWKVMQDSVMFVWGLQDDEDGLLLDDIKIKAVDFATNVVSKVGTSTNKMRKIFLCKYVIKLMKLVKFWKKYGNYTTILCDLFFDYKKITTCSTLFRNGCQRNSA
jgi:hypothetical protein